MTAALSRPHLPGPPMPSTGSPLCPLAQVRGIQKKSVMESRETYFFFRSWEQRGQNLKPDMEKSKAGGKWRAACVLTPLLGQSRQLLPQPSLTISLEAWWSAPHRQSGTTRWNTGKGRWNTAVREGPEEGGGKGRLQTPERCPLLQFRNFPKSPATQANHHPIPHPSLHRVTSSPNPEETVLTSGLSQPIISP